MHNGNQLRKYLLIMDILQNLGPLALGSRFRRISDQLMQDGILVYRDSGLDFEPRWFPVYYYLKDMGPSAVTDIARGLGITHPAVNQVAKELMNADLVAAYKDRSDKRKRVLALTSLGKQKLQELEPVWADIRQALQELLDDSGAEVLGCLAAMESALKSKSFHRRFLSYHEKPQNPVELVKYRPELAEMFRVLNEAWITDYFVMEEADRRALGNPESYIIEQGGEIIFARDMLTQEILGTCAIIRRDDALCELAKMAVSKSSRGRGIGKLLGEEVIRVARDMGFMKMYLETNSILKPALGLYRDLGFVQREFPHQTDYLRADVYMDLVL